MQILLLVIIIWDLKKIVLLKNENLKRIILNAELYYNYFKYVNW